MRRFQVPSQFLSQNFFVAAKTSFFMSLEWKSTLKEVLLAIRKKVEEAVKPCSATDLKSSIRNTLDDLQAAAGVIAGEFDKLMNYAFGS